jgi:hypothetical protein
VAAAASKEDSYVPLVAAADSPFTPLTRPLAKLTPGSVSYYIVKIRGKLESGLAVKTVSITADVGDTGLGREMAVCSLRARGGFYDTGTKNGCVASRGDCYDRKFLETIIF